MWLLNIFCRSPFFCQAHILIILIVVDRIMLNVFWLSEYNWLETPHTLIRLYSSSDRDLFLCKFKDYFHSFSHFFSIFPLKLYQPQEQKKEQIRTDQSKNCWLSLIYFMARIQIQSQNRKTWIFRSVTFDCGISVSCLLLYIPTQTHTDTCVRNEIHSNRRCNANQWHRFNDASPKKNYSTIADLLFLHTQHILWNALMKYEHFVGVKELLRPFYTSRI